MSHAHAADAASLDPGSLIADRFVVNGELGAGGSAVVYEAHDRLLDRPVALKLLGASAASHIDQSRFEREIRLTARLVHPAIVPVFDSGWHRDRPYYVMPCMRGATLRRELTTSGRVPIPRALRLAGDVAEALAYAHALGIVHRDIKPENVFVASGRAIVADFGIARAIAGDTTSQALTEEGLAIGTVAYISPEQALGEASLDGRADLYSLGCMLFELLSGEPPFRGATSMQVVAQHLSAAPNVADRLRDAPRALVSLLEQLLAKSPEERPPSATAVIEALHDATNNGGGLTMSPVSADVAPHTAVASQEESEADRALREARRLYSRGVQGGDGAGDVLALARVLTEKALKLEPQNVKAMGVLADIVQCQGFRGFLDEAASFDEAQRIRLGAAAIDDTVGELQTSLGVARLYWQDDFHGAERYLARGAALNPSDAIAQRHYATWLKMAGQFDAALSAIERAVTMAPDAPHVLVGLADIQMAMGRYVEAITPLQQALRVVPRYSQAMERLEMTCHRAGLVDMAFDARRTLLGTQRLHVRLHELSETFETAGWATAREHDLRQELATLLDLAEREDPFVDRHTSRQTADRIIITCGELGDWKQAMDWVERGYYVRPGRLIRVLTDLPFDRRGLAPDRRYARLVRTAGLEFLL